MIKVEICQDLNFLILLCMWLFGKRENGTGNAMGELIESLQKRDEAAKELENLPTTLARENQERLARLDKVRQQGKEQKEKDEKEIAALQRRLDELKRRRNS